MTDENNTKKSVEFPIDQVFVRDSSNTIVAEAQYKETLRRLDSGHPTKTESGVGRALLLLASTIRESNLTTTELSKKANKLIRWYVILTAILAVTTVTALIISLLKS